MADRVRAVPQDWVEMRHPGIELSQRCAPSAVKHWEARGWALVKTSTDEKKPGPAPKPAAPGQVA